MKNYRLHLIRHGITTANEEGVYAGGKTDCELSNKGISELIRLKEEYDYPGVELIYCAPLHRCVQTVNVVYPDKGIILVDDLAERDFGEFEGKKFDELKDQPEFQAFLADSTAMQTTGENMRDYGVRVLRAGAAVLDDMVQNEVSDAALVTDGGVIMTLLSAIAFPRQPMASWMCGPGKGFTCFVNPQIWTRDRLIEAAGILPYGLEKAL